MSAFSILIRDGRGCIRWFFLRRQTSREALFPFSRRWGLRCSVAERETSSRQVPGGTRKLRIEQVRHGTERKKETFRRPARQEHKLSRSNPADNSGCVRPESAS